MPPRPKRDERAEQPIGGDADHRLDAAGDHRLDEHAIDRVADAGVRRAGQRCWSNALLTASSFCRFRMHAADLGLVLHAVTRRAWRPPEIPAPPPSRPRRRRCARPRRPRSAGDRRSARDALPRRSASPRRVRPRRRGRPIAPPRDAHRRIPTAAPAVDDASRRSGDLRERAHGVLRERVGGDALAAGVERLRPPRVGHHARKNRLCRWSRRGARARCPRRSPPSSPPTAGHRPARR